jgi:CRP/FNR family transcriptional regulator, nitrogen oxide reductase regulator
MFPSTRTKVGGWGAFVTADTRNGNVRLGVANLPTQSKLLAGIPDHDQQLILGIAEPRRVSAREMIIRCGEQADVLFLLYEGNVKYYRVTDRGEELVLWWLTPGDVFGLATLLKKPPGYIGSAEARNDCTLWSWNHSSIRNLSIVYPQLSENALRITMGYLAAYIERHARVVTRTARQRLAHTLVQLGHRTGRTSPSGIDIDVTNQQLGGLADVGLFTVSRLLGSWERQGTIAKARGKIRVHAPEKLLTD